MWTIFVLIYHTILMAVPLIPNILLTWTTQSQTIYIDTRIVLSTSNLTITLCLLMVLIPCRIQWKLIFLAYNDWLRFIYKWNSSAFLLPHATEICAPSIPNNYAQFAFFTCTICRYASHPFTYLANTYWSRVSLEVNAFSSREGWSFPVYS